MPQPPSERRLRDELETYYGPLLPLWDRTLAGRGDLEFWRRVSVGWRRRRVLELGAGSGRVTEVLAPSVRSVVALDLVPAALRRARRRLRGADNVLPVAADMRTFRLDARFEVVLAANDPFSHLRSDEGRRRALARVAGHLTAGGRFYLDALWFPDERLEAAAAPGGRVTHTRVPPGSAGEGGSAAPETAARGDEDGLRIRQRWRVRRDPRLCEAEYEIFRGGRRIAASTFRGRYWTREEVEQELRRAGLAVEEIWGDYGGSPWTPSSPHLVVAAGPA